MKTIFKFFTVMVMCAVFSVKADVYAVYGIQVDVTAENATKAKEQGIAEAQEKAFYKMLDRLTLFKDLEALPVLSTEDILNLVRDFSVSGEKTSSVRYIANVDVQFDPQAIQKFFQEHKVPYVGTSAQKTLVFPVYRDADSASILLWKDTNLWAKILSKVSQSSDLVPLVVPLGDVDDMAIVNEDNWSKEQELNISALLKRYDCKEAMVADLSIQSDNIVKVTIRPFQNVQGQFKSFTLTEPIDAAQPAVLKRVAERVLYLLEQSWREQNAVRFDDPTQIEASVYIKDLTEWLEIRKSLDKVSLIKQYIVKTLRPDKAEIEIFYVGSLDAFNDALKKEKLFLLQQDEKMLLKKLSEVSVEELNIAEQEKMPDNTDFIDKSGSSINLKENEKNEEDTVNNVRTFNENLYEQIQPETMDIFDEIKKSE